MNSPATKADIRAATLAKRAGVSETVRVTFAERLAVIGPNLLRDAAQPFTDPVVSLYSAIRGEAETWRLAEILAKVGITTALPITIAPAQPLLFRRWAPGDPLLPGPWGIGLPSRDAPVVEPDVLFVPLAAFDRRGSRLGYGAGYYDATLAALRHRKPVRAIGVAFACQEVLFLPREEHDQPLDLVVTERDTILCRD